MWEIYWGWVVRMEEKKRWLWRPELNKGTQLVATVEMCHIWWLLMMWLLELRGWKQAGSGMWVLIAWQTSLPLIYYIWWENRVSGEAEMGSLSSLESSCCLCCVNIFGDPRKLGCWVGSKKACCSLTVQALLAHLQLENADVSFSWTIMGQVHWICLACRVWGITRSYHFTEAYLYIYIRIRR